MMKHLLILCVIISFYSHTQNNILLHIDSPINRSLFELNKKKFIKKYNNDKKFKISFSECQLIGVERDIISKMNYYFFQDEDKINFTVFEYYEGTSEVSSKVYNLSLFKS